MLGNWKVKPLESYTTGKGLICLAETESVPLKFNFIFISNIRIGLQCTNEYVSEALGDATEQHGFTSAAYQFDGEKYIQYFLTNAIDYMREILHEEALWFAAS